jgi:hypothetical protein
MAGRERTRRYHAGEQNLFRCSTGGGGHGVLRRQTKKGRAARAAEIVPCRGYCRTNVSGFQGGNEGEEDVLLEGKEIILLWNKTANIAV